MSIITKAFFVQRPRTITDLVVPGGTVTEARFKIVQIVLLKAIDYENFITDMLVDRVFLTASPYCHVENDIWYCLFVSKRGAKDGILVMPRGDFVEYAAYLTYDGNLRELASLHSDPDRFYTRDELEKMTSEELGNLLDEHLYLSYASEAYTDFILLVLDVLEKRERAVDPDEVDETWEEFKRRFLCPQEDDEEDDDMDDAYDDFED